MFLRRIFLTAIVLIAPQLIFAQQSQIINYKKQIDKCYGEEATASSISCFDVLNSKLDTQLDYKYKSLVKWVENEKSKPDAEHFLDEYEHKLSLSQRAWEVYININCEAVALPFSQGSGVMGLINMQRCSAQEKINRLEALEEFYPR